VSKLYNVNGEKTQKIEAVTFKELGMIEDDIENILRRSIDLICDEEESMLVVGRQVQNEKLGRSDLTAIDNNETSFLSKSKEIQKI
jgi:hypothetical protein